MEIILPHIHADFDALGSAVAAARLYPRARIVFPGAQERNVREFLAAHPELIRPLKIRDVDPNILTRIILVDLNAPERLGEVKSWLSLPGVEIIRFDHHLSQGHALPAHQAFIAGCGATVTILVQQLRGRGLMVSPGEATLLALGIYEETGFLTYTSTTPEDLEAAAFLLRSGAQLPMVSEFIGRSLAGDQEEVFQSLLKSRETFDIHGVDVSLAQAECSEYVPDLAAVAQKLRDLENLNALFALCRMGERIFVVGRSRTPNVNAARILEPLGGGGHATAASAVVRDINLKRVRKRLLNLLQQAVFPAATVKDSMSRPVVTAGPDDTVAFAREIMLRHGHSGLPVVEQGRLAGIITLHDVDKALHHGLSQAPIRDYMSSQPVVARARDPLSVVQQLMLDHRVGHIPILEGSRLAGIITRTDILRSLQAQENRPADFPQPEVLPEALAADNLANWLRRRLPQRWVSVLHTAGETADRLGCRVFLVGGSVRDLFLAVEHLDVDLVVEGDGVEFARQLAAALGGEAKAHARFQTAQIRLEGGFRLDVATARTEFYPRPAALPQVEASDLKYDLVRRDFTINAMAVQLNTNDFGLLLDFFGGRRDLAAGLIRVLHPLSFVDDPTRIFRAVRFEQRYRFRLEPDTERYLQNALKLRLVAHLAGGRLFDELLLILAEEQPDRALQRLAEFNVLAWIHPKLTQARIDFGLIARLWDVFAFAILFLREPIDRPAVYLMALLDKLTCKEAEDLAERLRWPRRLRDTCLTQKQAGEKLHARLATAGQTKISTLAKWMRGLPAEVLLFTMARTPKPQAAKWIREYLSRWQHVRTALNGRDLKKLGYPPGPPYDRMLKNLLAARLDGALVTRQDEERYLRKNYPLK